MASEGLVCVECGRHATGTARGWRAYLVEADEDDPEEGNVEDVVFFCPVCAAREFGERVTGRADK